MPSSKMSTSPAREGSANAGSANGLDEKPRLSEHEKKANHIASGVFISYPISETAFLWRQEVAMHAGMSTDKICRTKAQTGHPRRLRSSYRISPRAGGARTKRKCSLEEDSGLYASATGGEKEAG